MSVHEILDTEVMLEDFFQDATLLGIGCAMPCYQFCWLINQSFDMDFAMICEIEMKGSRNTPDYFFPLYRFELPLNGGELLIYSIKSGKKRLLPELKNLDYIWLIRGSASLSASGDFLKGLQKLPQVTLAVKLHAEQLPSVQNLLV